MTNELHETNEDSLFDRTDEKWRYKLRNLNFV